MKQIRFNVKGHANLELKAVKIESQKSPTCIVQIFHGMGEHKERYLEFMKYLANHGITSYIHDHRKHGASVEKEEERGIFTKHDNFDDMVDDAYFISREILKEHPGKKIIVLGHSMGSIIARHFISKYRTIPYAAIIMGTLAPIGNIKISLFNALGKVMSLIKRDNECPFLANQINKPLLIDYEDPDTKFEWLSYNKENIQNYLDDSERCGFAYNPKFYCTFFKGIKKANESSLILNGRDIPLLFISGRDDPVGDYGEGVDAVKELYNGHGFTELTLKLVNKNKHEVLHEDTKQETYKYIYEWIINILP